MRAVSGSDDAHDGIARHAGYRVCDGDVRDKIRNLGPRTRRFAVLATPLHAKRVAMVARRGVSAFSL